MPGWKSDITKVRRFSDLPQNAQNYVREVEALVGAQGELKFKIVT